MTNIKRERVVIIGSGPAGFAAAVYTARAQLKPVMIVGPQLGGQLGLTHEIENYPGVLSMSGMDLVEQFKQQSEHFGTELVYDVVESVDFSKGTPFTVKTTDTTYLADTVIVTIGANPRKLGVPGEDEGVGAGVSYCGTCDGFFFRGKEIVVVGGGDSAIEAALAIAEQPKTEVRISYRREAFSRIKPGNRTRLDEAVSRGELDVLWRTNVARIAEDRVWLVGENDREVPVANDQVLIFAGGELPTPFLKACGVAVDTKFGAPR
jgi:thioredoxin reductase (NADPH)